MRSPRSRAQVLRLARGPTFSSCKITVNCTMTRNCEEDIPSSDVMTGSFKHGAAVCEYCGTKLFYEGIEQCGVC